MSFFETSPLKNSTVMFLYSERDRIKLDPEYQRSGGVWTREKKQLLIDSILNDYDIPKIYFHRISEGQKLKAKFDFAVIDGRQRLETIWDFMDGKFPIAKDFEYQRDESIVLAGLNYVDLAKEYPKVRVKFDSFVLPVVTVDTDDLDLIEDMFSRLNEAVPLNAAEKRNAIGGDLVAAIREISEGAFFREKVAFGSKRAQFKEVSARFLLVEENLIEDRFIDTKKVYLDAMALRLREGHAKRVRELKASVSGVLATMNDVFMEKDELLRAQGNMIVYYLLFRGAAAGGQLGKITRRKLLAFRQKLDDNRIAAAADYADADFELLEYDRLSQQGTNDASNIKQRYELLAKTMGLTPRY